MDKTRKFNKTKPITTENKKVLGEISVKI